MPAGEVLPSAESVCREGGGVQGSVPHVHHSRSPALVWEDRTRCGMHRYEKSPILRNDGGGVTSQGELQHLDCCESGSKWGKCIYAVYV